MVVSKEKKEKDIYWLMYSEKPMLAHLGSKSFLMLCPLALEMLEICGLSFDKANRNIDYLMSSYACQYYRLQGLGEEKSKCIKSITNFVEQNSSVQAGISAISCKVHTDSPFMML